MSAILRHARRLALDNRVILFDINLSNVGGPVQRVAPMSNVIGDGRVLTMTSTSTGLGACQLPDTSALMTPGRSAIFKLIYRRTPSARTVRLYLGDPDHIYVGINSGSPASAPVKVRSGTTPPDLSLVEMHSSGMGPDHGFLLVSVPTGPWLNRARVVQNIVATASLDILEFSAWLETDNGDLERLHDISDLDVLEPHVGATFNLARSEQLYLPIKWRGQEYQIMPIEADGFEITGDGQMPRPRVSVSNVLGTMTTLVQQYGDLAGAEVTRWVTFRRFLDDGATPDVNAHLPKEIYTIDQMTMLNKQMVEWELTSVLDQQGVLLPGRQVIRGGCQFVYRSWNGSAFDYSGVDCPYTGSNSYRSDNTPTTSAQDKCSHTLPGCTLRFPSGPIPFGGFPGAGRISR